MRLTRRRFRRRPSAAALLGLALLAAIGARWIFVSFLWPVAGQSAGPLLREGPGRVVRVIDGYTLLVRQEPQDSATAPHATVIERRVRLLGIQIETAARATSTGTENWPAQAAELLSQETADREVQLKFDKRRIDRDENCLAYVYIDEALLNEQLVRAGLARVLEYPGDSQPIAKRLRAAEGEAKRAGRGLWSADNL